MTFQPKTIQKSMPATFHILCNRRWSTYGPKIPIQDIKYFLYQMISFLQFKHNHCFYFLCCNNYNSRLYSNQGLTGPSGYFYLILDMKLSLFLLLDLAFGVKFFISPGTKKCLKEEIHKDVVVTGDFSFTPSPKHRVSIESGIKSCKIGLKNCILKLLYHIVNLH